MGTHAFEGEPELCALYREHVGPDLPTIYGVDERWNMPVSRHRRVLSEWQRFPSVNHYILTYYLDGSSVRRLDGETNWGTAGKGAISLERPMSPAVHASSGAVDYGHLYFRQSLVCEIADELGLSEVAEPDDFFGMSDQDWARDVETYILRATDCSDPPTSMEMDSRAYLIGVGMLRTARNLSKQLAGWTDTVARADVRVVLQEIDKRLSETLRLSDLADLMDMSPFHFARVFKAETGETPANYLMRRRTERAIELIQKSDIGLAEVAYRSGFSSQSHMTRRIKVLTGKTPGALRSKE